MKTEPIAYDSLAGISILCIMHGYTLFVVCVFCVCYLCDVCVIYGMHDGHSAVHTIPAIERENQRERARAYISSTQTHVIIRARHVAYDASIYS